jgi:hypothetical protein
MSLLSVGRNRRTIRQEVNPMDKCTVVSIFPKEINEVKHTIEPGHFHLDKGSFDEPYLLVVGPSSWWRDIDMEQPFIEIPVHSVQIASSIVKDYSNGLLACNMADCMPGLFYIPGAIDKETLFKKYRIAMLEAQTKQNNWYRALVKLGDQLWSRSNGNPLVIADYMRLAAKELGLSNKDWMTDHQALDMIRCVACGALRNPLFPICGSCHRVIDMDLAVKLGLEPKQLPEATK